MRIKIVQKKKRDGVLSLDGPDVNKYLEEIKLAVLYPMLATYSD